MLRPCTGVASEMLTEEGGSKVDRRDRSSHYLVSNVKWKEFSKRKNITERIPIQKSLNSRDSTLHHNNNQENMIGVPIHTIRNALHQYPLIVRSFGVFENDGPS